jgi:hypothetical protein
VLHLLDYQVFISIFINIHYPELRLNTVLIILIVLLSSNFFAQNQINNSGKKFSTTKDSILFRKLIEKIDEIQVNIDLIGEHYCCWDDSLILNFKKNKKNLTGRLIYTNSEERHNELDIFEKYFNLGIGYKCFPVSERFNQNIFIKETDVYTFGGTYDFLAVSGKAAIAFDSITVLNIVVETKPGVTVDPYSYLISFDKYGNEIDKLLLGGGDCDYYSPTCIRIKSNQFRYKQFTNCFNGQQKKFEYNFEVNSRGYFEIIDEK